MTEPIGSQSVPPAPESDMLKGVRAMLFCPTYGPVEPNLQKHLRVAMMTCSNHGIYWAGDTSTDKMGFSGARNCAAQALIDNPDADGCMWVDSDILMAPGIMARLINTAVVNKLDILSGVYHQRSAPFKPVFYHYDKKKDYFKQVYSYAPDMLIFPGGCGFGFVWTSRKVIVDIAQMKDFEPTRGGWFPDNRNDVGGKGEDLAFCSKAQRAGYDIYVDTGIQVGHMGDSNIVGYKDYLDYRKLHPEEDENPPKPGKFGL